MVLLARLLAISFLAAAISAEPAKVAGKWNVSLQLESITGHPVILSEAGWRETDRDLRSAVTGSRSSRARSRKRTSSSRSRSSPKGMQTQGVFGGTVDGDTMSGNCLVRRGRRRHLVCDAGQIVACAALGAGADSCRRARRRWCGCSSSRPLGVFRARARSRHRCGVGRDDRAGSSRALSFRRMSQARTPAFAYGGSLIQDIGYYPFSSRFFGDLTHYVRSGDFIEALIRSRPT